MPAERPSSSFSRVSFAMGQYHTGYPETTNATDNNKRSWNQQARIGCKYLSGSNLPRIKLIRELRPTSAFPAAKSSKRGKRTISASVRPRSGKSSLYTGSDVFSSTANSRPTSGYTSRGTSARTRDGLTSGRRTLTSSVREGARSPTPNAIRDMEPAFFDVQLFSPGITIWRIQGSSLRTIDVEEIGFFHEGNAYLVLSINEAGDKSLHYWTGQLCTEKDSTLVEEKARELDRIISYAHVFSREAENFESYNFLRHFPDGIIYMEGKHKTGIKEASVYDKRLYLVTGRKYPRASCVYPKKEYIQRENALILDGYPRIYVWVGRKCSYIKRVKAIRIAQRLMRAQRKGKCHIIVIDEDDIARHDVFVKKLDHTVAPTSIDHLPVDNVNSHDTGNVMVNGCTDDEGHIPEVVLHRLSGDRVLYDMPEAARRPIYHRYLVKKDSYLLDRGPDRTLYVWVGSDSCEDNILKGLERGKTFAEYKEYSRTRTVCRIRENHEPLEFRNCFCDWKDRSSRETALTKTYTIGNVERALFSHTDKRTIATVKECWSDEALEPGEGSTVVYVLQDQKTVLWQHHGVFESNKCYIVLHSIIASNSLVHLLYFWMGSSSTKEDQDLLVQYVFENKNIRLYKKMVRVLDGKEPPDFMEVMNDSIMVYDSEITSSPQQTTQMFAIKGVGLHSVRIQQVKPCWSSLNSSAAAVILTSTSIYLWYGKDSGCMERESTKELLALICSQRMFTYDIVAEGKEPLGFYKIFGGLHGYKADFPPKAYERRVPRLIQCDCKMQKMDFTFIEIEDFLQEDLVEEEVLILDIFDEICIWCGDKVDKETRQRIPAIAKEYIRSDPAGREPEDILLSFVTQGNEPTFFAKFFSFWDTGGYSGSRLYEVSRKRVRQENAHIDITESLIDRGFVGQPKYPYPLLLKKKLPEDVDDMHKEYHLTEKQFRENLLVSRQEFYHLPQWKQKQILRSAKLLYTPPLPLHTLELPET